MNRDSPLQIGKGKGCLPVAAVHGAQQREQCLVLIYRQELAIAKGPPLRSKIPTDYFYLTHKRSTHFNPPLLTRPATEVKATENQAQSSYAERSQTAK